MRSTFSHRAMVVFAAAGLLLASDPLPASKLAGKSPNLSRDSELYSLKTQGCSFTFESRKGGIATKQSTDERAGYFVHEGLAKHTNVSISFECVSKPAAEHCPSVALSPTAEDPSTWAMMRVIRHSPIHAHYEGEAFTRSFTAVPVPRQRQLTFCLGDNKRSLVGSAMVGNERRDTSAMTLRILKTIRLLDVSE
jgi:hypothetical protein